MWTSVEIDGVCLGRRRSGSGMYLRTVLGDTRRPSLSKSSLAMRSCPQVGILQGHATNERPQVPGQSEVAPVWISTARTAKALTMPTDEGLRFHDHQQPLRQSKKRLSQTSTIRVALLARRGLTWRS